jgi:prepilin-type N-terminal cleavage/methylation domain-containing protein
MARQVRWQPLWLYSNGDRVVRMRKQRGFTLVEVLLVIGVITVLGGIAWVVVGSMDKPKPQPINLVETQNLTSLQQNQINTQAKNDLSVAAGAVLEYVANNNGSYPTSADQIDALLKDGAIVKQPFTSPITKTAYSATLNGDTTQGVANLVKGKCNADKTSTEAAQSSRQYAMLTTLVDGKTVYCVDL